MANFCLFPTALGPCGIAWRDGVVVATHLPEGSETATAARLARRAGAVVGAPPLHIQLAIAAITALLEGEKIDLNDIACDFSRIDAFSTQVYAITRAILVGETLTYGDIAVQLGDRRLAQRVGQALGRNPFPIIVPCHRVMGANAKLTGFSAGGGVATKLKMLAIEGAQIGEAPSLFGDLPLAIRPRG
jgi:methylated-DNA-[protein]-cysteine S-methyltransferase